MKNLPLFPEEPPIPGAARIPGAIYNPGKGYSFTVWAPFLEKVQVHIISPANSFYPMQKDDSGYFHLFLEDAKPGWLYQFALNREKEYPDPASRLQPEGVHGPSQIIDFNFEWKDKTWRGIPLEDYILYELHVGTFSREGTFEAIIPKLKYLKDLGISAIELMPIAQFPGGRNWGYDGVYPYAAQNTYGGVKGLKKLVNACHQAGLAVILDVVYNHLGPEGNYLANFAPYFTDHYKTPWGKAINFDGAYSDEVRYYFIQNALYWIRDCHLDGLRLDALHSIVDTTAKPFLEELASAVHAEAEKLNRKIYLWAETSLNDPRLILPVDKGGFNLDAQWNDDFHHSLHTSLTLEKNGYYADFQGIQDLAKAFHQGYVYTGEYSRFRKRKHGRSSKHIPFKKFVVFSQNHDQIGNRILGERLSHLVPFEKLKLAAALVLLSPFIPLFFMGEEYGETAPFQYFISHQDPDLVQAVRKGRKAEFSSFSFKGEFPDPQHEETFLKCKLHFELAEKDNHAALLNFYRKMIRFRTEHLPLKKFQKTAQKVFLLEKEKTLFILQQHGEKKTALIFNFSNRSEKVSLPFPKGMWKKMIDSSEKTWNLDSTRSQISNPVQQRIKSSGGKKKIPLLIPFSTVLVFTKI
jgi:maltooligosyltrehalose trehalohydrolase